jgi:hypothetical protein
MAAARARVEIHRSRWQGQPEKKNKIETKYTPEFFY